MGDHLHDVCHVNVAITVQVVAGVPIGIGAGLAPADGYQHDVNDVHVAIAVEVRTRLGCPQLSPKDA